MANKRPQHTYVPHPDEFHNSDYRGLGEIVKRDRAQAPKSRRSPKHQREVLELRRSGATVPFRSPKDYQRKPKHVNKGWE